MEITGIGTQKEFVRKLYTGICKMKVLTVNPTKEELADILGHDKTPAWRFNYTENKEGVDVTQITFWLQNEEHSIIEPLTLYVRNEKRISQAGQNQYINHAGMATFAGSLQEALDRVAAKSGKKWFAAKGAREAMNGEAGLIDFLLAWAGVDTRNEGAGITLKTDWAELCSGDVSEIDKHIPILKEMEVPVLLTIKDEQYQSIWTKGFGLLSSSYKKDIEYAESNGKGPDYGGSFVFKEYVPGQAPVETATQASASEMDDLMAGLE